MSPNSVSNVASIRTNDQTQVEKPANVIPFNRPFHVDGEKAHLDQVRQSQSMGGGGKYYKKCQSWIEDHIQVGNSIFTHSCTHALELAALNIGIQAGDEVIMPSFTFTSTANAFALRGGIPVFVDIRSDTLNLDERLIEDAITSRTRAIVPVHYAGVSCEMDAITKIASKHGIDVIEDAAHAFLATYRGRMLGSIGNYGTFSFHETKGIHCGEGGVLLANDKTTHHDLSILVEKGTNRTQFLNGQVDKYTWVGLGSSYLAGELPMAFLYAQFEQALEATQHRLRIWQQYHEALKGFEASGVIRRPIIPNEATHNAHLYYLLLPDVETRNRALQQLQAMGIGATFHYVPLHSSKAGLQFCRAHGDLPKTENLSERLLRLPLWMGMNRSDVSRVIDSLEKVLQSLHSS